MLDENETVSKDLKQSSQNNKLKVDNPPLEIHPRELNFLEQLSHQAYEATITIMNVSKYTKKVRVTRQPSPSFSLHYTKVDRLAPGMSMTISLKFEPMEALREFNEFIVLETDDYAYQMPLKAYPSKAQLFYSYTLNLGFVSRASEKKDKMTFINKGTKTAHVKLDKLQSNSDIIIHQEQFSVDPEGKLDIPVTIKGIKVGQAREVVKVIVNGEEQERSIDILATVIDHTVALVDFRSNKPLQSINFEKLFQGDKKKQSTQLCNNGPNPVNQRIKIANSDMSDSKMDLITVTTPQSLGVELANKILSMDKPSGTIDPFDSTDITFTLLAETFEKSSGFVIDSKQFNDRAKKTDDFDENSTKYSFKCQVLIDEIDQKIEIPIEARAFLPQLIVNEAEFFFQECSVNEAKEQWLVLQNRNDQIPVKVEFEKVPQFNCEVRSIVLAPNETQDIRIIFQPHNLGSFNQTMNIWQCNKRYCMPIKLYGTANKVGTKQMKSSTFSGKNLEATMKTTNNVSFQKSKNSKDFNYENSIHTNRTENMQAFLEKKENQSKATDQLRQMRIRRIHDQTNKKFKMERRGGQVSVKDEVFDEDVNLGMRLPELPAVRLTLSDIDYNQATHGKRGNEPEMLAVEHNPLRVIKKKQPSVYNNLSIMKEIEHEITPQELQRISVGPSQQDQGQVFVRSANTFSFSVFNGNSKHILVELQNVENDSQMSINPAAQIIPPSVMVSFEVTFRPLDSNQRVTLTVGYKINNQHEFKLPTRADTKPCELKADRTSLNFKFHDNSYELTSSEIVKLRNLGNSDVKFNFIVPDKPTFNVKPKTGVVKPGTIFNLEVVQSPTEDAWKKDEETLLCKIEDGNDLAIKCQGTVPQSKLVSNSREVNFGSISIGGEAVQTFVLKNTMKTHTLFNVRSSIEGLTIHPTKGKVGPNDKCEISFQIDTSQPSLLKDQVDIDIRGGKPMTVPIMAEILVPNINVDVDNLDFGEVIVGKKSTIPFGIRNESQISSTLQLDLREYNDFTLHLEESSKALINLEYLELMPNEEKKDKKDEEQLEDEDEDEQLEEEMHRIVVINLQPKMELKFQFTFSPTTAKGYKFDMPFFLSYTGTLKRLRKIVSAFGIMPVVKVSSNLIDFKRIVVSQNSNAQFGTSELILSNNTEKDIHFRAEQKNPEEVSNAFSFNSSGVISSFNKHWLKITFKPIDSCDYNDIILIQVDKNPEPMFEVTLKGEGTMPRLIFDKQEVVMPIVPLQVETKVRLTIINQGYDNIELKSRFNCDQSLIKVRVDWPDGCQLGVTKQKLTVLICQSGDKPFGFTTKLFFFDANDNSWTINVSAVTDNCIFSNYTWLHKNQDDGKIIPMDKETELNFDYDDLKGDSIDHEKAERASGIGSINSISGSLVIGHDPNNVFFQEKTCKFICKWMKDNVVLNKSIDTFPYDVTNNQLDQIQDLLKFLGQKPPQKPKGYSKGILEKANELIKQYDELISQLTSKGCLMNTVKSHYLLEFATFKIWLKENSANEYIQRPRQVEKLHSFYLVDSMVTMFYQIMKVFYLKRIDPKQIKNVPGLFKEEINPNNIYQKSNIYSQSELIVIKWLQVHKSRMQAGERNTLKNFRLDFRDGTTLNAVIQSHYKGLNALKNFKNVVTNEEEIRFNNQAVINALKEIGVKNSADMPLLTSATDREMLMFVLEIFFKLPYYNPKAKIEFNAILGETCSKNIEITNPGKKRIEYNCRVEGAQDFQLENDQLIIEPGEKVNLTVNQRPRVSKENFGRLAIVTSEHSITQATPIVFELVARVVERKTTRNQEVEGRMQQMENLNVDVTNTFDEDVDFSISLTDLIPRYDPNRSKIEGDDAGPKRKKKNEKYELYKCGVDNKTNPPVPNAFWIKQTSIKLKRGQTKTIQVQFLPFENRLFRNHLVFSDPTVGEFQQELVGKGLMPELYQAKLFRQCQQDESMSIELAFNVMNTQMERAKQQLIERNSKVDNKKGDIYERSSRAKFIKEKPTQWSLEYTSPYFQGDKLVNIPAGDLEDRKISVSFTPSSAGIFNTVVTIKSVDNPLDIRTMELEVNVIPSVCEQDMEITCPARQSVVQPIPIINRSQMDQNVKIELKSDSKAFTGSGDLTVRRGSTENQELKFAPNWIGKCNAVLQVKNSTTSEVITQKITGVATEPRAIKHLKVTGKARSKIDVTVEIQNDEEQTKNFKVDSDMPGVSGDSSFAVRGLSNKAQSFSIQSFVSGELTGSITFTDETGKFWWQIIELVTEQPDPQDVISLECEEKKVVEFSVKIKNPANKTSVFDVIMDGEGLLGENSFVLEAGKTKEYKLFFSPLFPFERKGTLRFLSEATGELWQKLNLKSTKLETKRLDDIQVELGKFGVQTIKLENPLQETIVFKHKLTNDINFKVRESEIQIPPFKTAIAHVVYYPSVLNERQECFVKFQNDQVGEFNYILSGTGVMPQEMATTHISCRLMDTTSSLINFKNPFNTAVVVDFELETDDPDTLKLMLKKEMRLEPLSMCQIPINFSPVNLETSTATLLVKIGNIVWSYPVVGITETKSEKAEMRFSTQSRKLLEDVVRCSNFDGIRDGELTEFTWKLLQPEDNKHLMDGQLDIRPDKLSVSKPTDSINFRMRFLPFKPLTTRVHLVLDRLSGGRYKFELCFESKMPEVDDVIVLESTINKASAVKFKLRNLFPDGKFHSYFQGKDSCFSASPKSGILKQNDDTEFTIVYKPPEQGKEKQTQFIIETEEMMWRQQINGRFPEYKPPVLTKGRLGNTGVTQRGKLGDLSAINNE